MTTTVSTSAEPRVTPHTRAPQRNLLIDVVRGMAITLVALGHTDQGILHRGWWGASSVGIRLDEAIYAFHMPAFFFVSGVFLKQGVEKRGQKGYALEKLRTIIYPYVLWTCIIAIAPFFFARFTIQTVPTWSDFLYGLVTGNASWFLPTLFCTLMLGMLLRRVPMPLLFLLSIAMILWIPRSRIDFEDRTLRHFVFLVAGMWTGNSIAKLQRIPYIVSAAIAALAAVFIVWATGKPYNEHLYIPLGLLGTGMLLLIARCLGRSAIAHALAWTGAASFGIFLISEFPQGAGREFLARVLHITAPWPQLLFPTLLAVLVPAWLYHRRKPLHIQWMFIWPF